MPQPRKGPEDEKVTVNLGPVDLGHIDLLVREGVYASRTDFIRDAIRRHLDGHETFVGEVVRRKEFQVGYLFHNRADLEKVAATGDRLIVRVLGVYKIADDVTLELAKRAFQRVTVLGSLRAPEAVQRWLVSVEGVDGR